MTPDFETVTFLTDDTVEIAAEYWPGGEQAVLLVHMMPATKESWYLVASRLAELGMTSLAIDLRGHGDSEEGPNGFQNFTDKEHQASIKDLQAAAAWLAEKGHVLTAAAGASIGANLVLEYGVMDSRVQRIGLLSPGTDYKGIQTLPLITQLKPEQKVLAAASTEDERTAGNAADMAQELFEANPQTFTKPPIIIDATAHGTDLFEEHLELANELSEWLAGQI